MHVSEVLQKLITFPTITPQECGIYAWIEDFLGCSFSTERMDCNEIKNLFAYKDLDPNSCRKKTHICFAGHIDVVPAGDGWDSNPFVPHIFDGYIYGRGSQDMKGGIACFLNAIKKFSSEECDIVVSILLTSDEEGDAICGTKYVLSQLEDRGFLPDIVIVAEPTSEKRLADIIKVGRRGSINGVLIIDGVQGHVAYPQKCLNPIELLGNRLGNIAGALLDEGDEFFEPSKIVVTDIRGGIEVCNVTPSHLRLMFNVRNSTQSDEKTIQNYLNSVLEGLSYNLTLKKSSDPFLTQSCYFDLLAQSVQNVVGYIPAKSTSGGTSDARYFASLGIDVLELGVLNDRIHAKNERVEIKDLESLERIFFQFLIRLGGKYEKNKH